MKKLRKDRFTRISFAEIFDIWEDMPLWALHNESKNTPVYYAMDPEKVQKNAAMGGLAALFVHGLNLIHGKIENGDPDFGLEAVAVAAECGLREAIMYMATYYLGLLKEDGPKARIKDVENAAYFFSVLDKKEQRLVSNTLSSPEKNLIHPKKPPKYRHDQNGKLLVSLRY